MSRNNLQGQLDWCTKAMFALAAAGLCLSLAMSISLQRMVHRELTRMDKNLAQMNVKQMRLEVKMASMSKDMNGSAVRLPASKGVLFDKLTPVGNGGADSNWNPYSLPGGAL